MSRPEWCPSDIWETAKVVAGCYSFMRAEDELMMSTRIASALIREVLPFRRFQTIHDFDHIEANGVATPFVAGIGFFPDNRVGEVFLNASQDGSTMGLICNDAAVVISIALQHGATVSELRKSVARYDGDERKPQSVIGTVLDLMESEQAS